jgi:hypothetical protein
MQRTAGILFIVGGICLVVVGLLIFAGGFRWFGHLPGDIRYEGEHTTVYIPIVSMLLVSLALSLIFSVINRFL